MALERRDVHVDHVIQPLHAQKGTDRILLVECYAKLCLLGIGRHAVAKRIGDYRRYKRPIVRGKTDYSHSSANGFTFDDKRPRSKFFDLPATYMPCPSAYSPDGSCKTNVP